jgi:galactofuranose transport system permease protein
VTTLDTQVDVTTPRARIAGVPKVLWPLAALALLIIFDILFVENFLRISIEGGRLVGYPVSIALNASRVMLLAMGMCLVIATRGIDLSVGAVMAITAAVAAEAANAGVPIVLVIALALAVATLAGVWNGILVAIAGVQPIVATLVLMVAGRGIAQLITRGQIPNFDTPLLVFIGQGTVLGIPFPLILVAIVFSLTLLLTRRTALGLMIESIGDSPGASRYVGIPVAPIKLLVYTFSGLCAGLAGLIDASLIRSADANNAGLYMELDAIFAVVVGGTALVGGRFYLFGAIVGALLLQTLTTTILAMDVRSQLIPMPKAIVIIAVILLQSSVLQQRISRALASIGWRRSVA